MSKVAKLENREGDRIVKNNPLEQLGMLGQSIWLDYIRRDLIVSGELRHQIDGKACERRRRGIYEVVRFPFGNIGTLN